MITTLWILFAVLIVLDLIIWAMRASLANARIPQLITLREQRPAVVEKTMMLLENPRVRPMLRLTVAMVHFLLGFVIYALLTALYPALAGLPAAAVVLALSGVVVVALEFFIEGRFLENAERWALRFTPLARLLNFLFTPISAVIMLLLGAPRAAQARPIPVTEDELKSWVEEDQPQSALEKGERKMIYSIFQFGETLCREIMVPRIDVLALEIETPLEKAIQELNRSGHSRVPVYEETIDNIIGVLYAKDLLKIDLIHETSASWRSLLRPAYFVPEAKKVDELLHEMQARGVHIALVVDEYGGVAGLVTLEDIMEEIFGEIRDEYDQSEELLFQQVNENEYIFHGRIDLDDFNEVVGTHLVKDVADTLGGYISAQVGRVPAGGERIQVEEWILQVEQVAGRRIRKVRVTRQQTPEMEQNGSKHE